MTAFVFANYVDTTLAAAASSTATSLSLSSSANLPTLESGDIMPLTLNDAATGLVYEIVYVTAISGTTLTVLRAQEGTSAQNWSSGDYAFTGPTAETVAPVAGTHSPVASETLPAANQLVVTPGTLTAAIDLTLNDAAAAGSGATIYGSAADYAVTVQSPVTTGSPYIELPDGSQVYSWTIPASSPSQGIKLTWDGTNWRAKTIGGMGFFNSSDSSSNVLIQPEPEGFAYAADYGLINSYYKSLGSSSGITFNGRFYTSIPSGTFSGGIWSLIGTVNYNGSGTSDSYSCVGIYGQGVRNTYSANGTSNTNPQVWGGVMEGRDLTNQPSLGTNATLGLEVDIYSNNVDNAQEPNIRKGIIVVNNEATAVSSGGYPAEVRVGIGTTTSVTSQFKKMLDLTGNYQLAAIDLRGSKSNGQESGSLPTVSTTLSSPSTTVDVSNILPFTSDRNGNDLNTGSYTLTVYINGTSYTATGYAFTGNGPGGTLTLSSDVSVANGTAGNTVVRNSAAIWLPTNVPIYLDENESAQLVSNGTGVTTLTSSLQLNNATSPDQAVALNQVAQVSPAMNNSIVSSPAANSTYNTSVTFTAPTAGFVVSLASVNTGSDIDNTLNLIVNGSVITNDTTLYSMSLSGVTSVSAGESVTVESQYVTGSTAPSQAIDIHVTAFFIPNP